MSTTVKGYSKGRSEVYGFEPLCVAKDSNWNNFRQYSSSHPALVRWRIEPSRQFDDVLEVLSRSSAVSASRTMVK